MEGKEINIFMRIRVQRVASLRKKDLEVAGYKVTIIQNNHFSLYKQWTARIQN